MATFGQEMKALESIGPTRGQRRSSALDCARVVTGEESMGSSNTPTDRRRSSHFVDGCDGAKQKASDIQDETKKPNIQWRDFFDTSKPWVLVKDGSLMGYFDWVPKHYRVGPWNFTAPLYIAALLSGAFYCCPSSGTMNSIDSNVSKNFDVPEAFSVIWWYNVLGFFFTLYLHSTFTLSGWFCYVTYTIQSWSMLTLRHGLCALSPLLPPGGVISNTLLGLNDALRFPTLVTATITSSVWNFILLPFVALVAIKDTKERRKFVVWCFSFRMTQVHLFNILYAALNCALLTPTPTQFTSRDLHIATSLAIVYGLFYVLILDRLGCHLYPVFSPRTPLFVLTWTVVLGCYYGSYCGWNWVIEDGTARDALFGLATRSMAST